MGLKKLSRRVAELRRGLSAGLQGAQAIVQLRTGFAKSLQAGLAGMEIVREQKFRNVTKVHEVRIALKHLRYGAEALPVSMRGFAPAQLKRLRTAVSALGRMHDVDVQLAHIKKLQQKGRLASTETAKYRAELASRRKKLAAKCSSVRSKETAERETASASSGEPA